MALSLSLGACANRNGVDLARKACTHVDRSLTLYRDSLHAPDQRQAGTEQSQALAELQDAQPLAATAAGEAGQFQGLMSTLAESDHLPESLLVSALTAQCAAADADNPFVPVTPPPSTGPTTTGPTPIGQTTTTGPAPTPSGAPTSSTSSTPAPSTPS